MSDHIHPLNEFGVIDPKDFELRQWAANELMKPNLSPAKHVRLALEKDDPDYLRRIVSSYGDPIDGNGNTALMLCADINRVRCSLALVGVVDLDRKKSGGTTALMISSKRANREWVEAMLPHVNPMEVDDKGDDALKYWIRHANRPPSDCLILASDLYAKDQHQNTSADLARLLGSYYASEDEQREMRKIYLKADEEYVSFADIALKLDAIRDAQAIRRHLLRDESESSKESDVEAKATGSGRL